MTTVDLAALVARARQGDQVAFHELVGASILDLRLFIASYVPTTALGEVLLRETYAAIRRELARCPHEGVAEWMCRTAATLVGMRLADVARTALAGKDPLAHIIAQNGAEALSLNSAGANPAARELPGRLLQQPPSLRQLLQRHYKDGLTVATIAEKQGLVEGEVAQALMSARARMDWTGVAEVGDTADHTFPSVVEDYLTGTLVPDTRALLVAGVMHDPTRAVQFERQVRMHMLLQVLLTPFEPAQVKEFIQSLPAHQESSRLVVPQRAGGGTRGRTTSRIVHPGKPPSGPRGPAETTRTRRQITETGSGNRGFVKGASGSRATVAVDDDDLGEDAPPPPNRLAFYLGGAAVVIGVLALLVLLWPSAPIQVVPVGDAPGTASATKAAGDPSFALINEAEGQVQIHHAGQQRAATVGDSLMPGDGLSLDGAGALGVLVADQVRVQLLRDTQVTGIALQGAVLELTLVQGRVQVDHRRTGTRVSQLLVRTPEGLATLPDAGALIEAVQGVTRVQVLRGKPQVARAAGTGAVEARSGAMVLVRSGSDPLIAGSGAFVRGINFGEGVVTMERNQWHSLAEALGGGLTLGAQAKLDEPVLISGVGMDFDSKRMLDTGLVGEGGNIELQQVLPNGDYDLSLWIAGRGDVRFDQIEVVVGGVPLASGASAKPERWRRLGPFRLRVSTGALELRLRGLGSAHLAGLQLDAAGPLQGSLPPMILITDPAPGGQLPPLDLVIRTRAEAAGGLAKVAFYNRDQLLGEALTPPYTFLWRSPPPGPYSLSAVASDSTGASSRSVAVSGTILELSQARGLIRETWRRVGGERVSDLRGHLATATEDIELVSDTNQRLTGVEFGARFRALVTPPTSGDYVFEVVSDDGCEVWLARDEDPANRRLVCAVEGFAELGNWGSLPGQRSTPIALTSGQRCFLEVLYKQGGGNSHLQLGWVRPDGTNERPIPADRFTPVRLAGPIPLARAVAPEPAQPVSAPGVVVGVAPPVVAREVPPAPAGPLLQGTVAPAPAVANLSDLGTADWIHYGLKDTSSVTRRVGGDLLTVARTADSMPIERFDNYQTRFAWSDGAPDAVMAATTTGWYTLNRGKGFTFSAPADPLLRRLMVWLGGNETHGVITATLSDGSAPAYRDASIAIVGGNGWHCCTLLYRARDQGAKLTFTYSPDKGNDGNVTLAAVALSDYGDGKPRFIKAINFGGDAAVIDGNPWTAHKDAENAGLLVHNSRRISGTGDPLPVVEAAMKPMLRSGVAAKGGDLEIHDRLGNGRYDVTLYVTETGVANSHLFDVTLNDAQLSDIGQLPKNGWAAYGPVTVQVAKGVLSLTAKGKKGSPQLMGMTVFTAGAAGGPWTNAFPAGRAHVVPGTILCANFDRGANGVAFRERDDKPNSFLYRTEPVGINAFFDAPVVANVLDGEWLRYSIRAAQAGTYTVAIRYGKATGPDTRNCRVTVEIDGKAVGEALRLEDTLRWDTPKTLTSAGVALTAGAHDLRLLFNGEQGQLGDFWSMEFTRTGP